MSVREGRSCSPTAACSRASCSAPSRRPAWRPARSCSTPPCRGYQEVITDPSYAGQIITFTYPHIGNYGANRADDESRPAVLPRRDRARSGPPAQQPPRRARPRRDAAPHGIPGIAGIDTRRLTRLLRDTGAMPGAFGTASDADCWQRPRPSPAPTASTWSPRSPRRAVHRRFDSDGAGAVDRRLRLRHQAHDRAHTSATLGRVDVVPASTTGRRRARPPARRRVPVERARRSGRRAVRRRHDPRPGRQRPGVRDLPRPSAARPGARRRHVQAPVRPPRRQPPGADLATGHVEITSQNHNFASTPTGSPASSTMTHVNLNDPSTRACGSRASAAFSVQYHPEAGPGPHDSRYLFELFAAHARRRGAAPDAEADRHPLDPDHRLGPDRDRPGVRVRLLRHAGVPGAARGGLPGHPRQLEPGDDHDRPRLRRRHVHRAADAGGGRGDHRARAARRGAARRSAARPG